MSRNPARDRADAAFRAAVYSRYGRACVRCGEHATEVAHVIRRGYDRTRCDPTNGRPACQRCHRMQHAGVWSWPELLGEREVLALRQYAEDPTWKRPRDWWQQCLTALKEVA